jgi:hypothetical protein
MTYYKVTVYVKKPGQAEKVVKALNLRKVWAKVDEVSKEEFKENRSDCWHKDACGKCGELCAPGDSVIGEFISNEELAAAGGKLRNAVVYKPAIVVATECSTSETDPAKEGWLVDYQYLLEELKE